MANGLLDAERQYLSRLFLLRLTNESYALASLSTKAEEIVQKWIDFFVLHKSIRPESITRRLK